MLARLRRLAAELVAREDEAAGDSALALLVARRDGDALVIERAGERARPLAEVGDDEAPDVRLAAGVYASIPASESRVRLLRLLRGATTGTVTLHVLVKDDATHASRALVDAPRRLLRRAGLPLAEPGDRHEAGRFLHCFFDDEALLEEIARAGLAVRTRRGSTFVLHALDDDDDAADANARADGDRDGNHDQEGSFALELPRVAALVPVVDRARRGDSPAAILAAMRARGVAGGRVRSDVGRARLRRAIGWVDALAPGGASCYRRILLECALDAGAARETVVFGLDVGRTGHVAFEGKEDLAFDVAFAIPAPAQAHDDPDDPPRDAA